MEKDAELADLRARVADWHKVANERSAEICRLEDRVAELEKIIVNCHREIYARDAEIKALRLSGSDTAQ